MSEISNGSRMVFRAATKGATSWFSDVEHSSASLDWMELARYACACGLARPLAASLPAEPGRDRSPRSDGPSEAFVDAIQARARRDVFRQLTQRSLLARIDRVLDQAGVSGVILKGAACLALTPPDASSPCRATGDVDLWVEPSQARRVHGLLLDAGFEGDRHALRAAPHHLSPVSSQGVEVEVHARLMPDFWGLPESEMLEDVRPLPGHQRLSALGPEAFLLHSVVHATAHLFAFGLKTAWDVAWVIREFPEIDWGRIAGWARAMRIERAFWVPLRVLCDELGLEVSSEVFLESPADARQRRLETIARLRLLQDATGAYELNPLSKNAVFLLLHDSWGERVGYLAHLRDVEAAESRASAREKEPTQAYGRLPAHLWDALRDWRAFRRAFEVAERERSVARSRSA